ncbi:uncharacterized protein DS421_13g443690 [Arachis hypogaea]|nr:uncharacterized protein DS421_13g443690 [Arachis hypogaea]
MLPIVDCIRQYPWHNGIGQQLQCELPKCQLVTYILQMQRRHITANANIPYFYFSKLPQQPNIDHQARMKSSKLEKRRSVKRSDTRRERVQRKRPRLDEQRAQQRRREAHNTGGEQIGDEVTGCSLAGESSHSYSDGGERRHSSSWRRRLGIWRTGYIEKRRNNYLY